MAVIRFNLSQRVKDFTILAPGQIEVIYVSYFLVVQCILIMEIPALYLPSLLT